jgi:hypothetical protein
VTPPRLAPAPATLSLPESLEPTAWNFSTKSTYVPDVGWVRGTDAVIRAVHEPLRPVPQRALIAVSACTAGILDAAKSHGAVRSEGTSASSAQSSRLPANTIPVEARVTYSGWMSAEVRQARIGCRLNSAGRVVDIVSP